MLQMGCEKSEFKNYFGGIIRPSFKHKQRLKMKKPTTQGAYCGSVLLDRHFKLLAFSLTSETIQWKFNQVNSKGLTWPQSSLYVTSSQERA